MTHDEDGPLTGSDYPFRDLSFSWLPDSLEGWLHDLTYNEIHAAGLGLVGIFVGVGWMAGFTMEAMTFTLFVIGMAFGMKKLPDDKPIAGQVVRREPWYFTTIYVLSALVGAGLAVVV